MNTQPIERVSDHRVIIFDAPFNGMARFDEHDIEPKKADKKAGNVLRRLKDAGSAYNLLPLIRGLASLHGFAKTAAESDNANQDIMMLDAHKLAEFSKAMRVCFPAAFAIISDPNATPKKLKKISGAVEIEDHEAMMAALREEANFAKEHRFKNCELGVDGVTRAVFTVPNMRRNEEGNDELAVAQKETTRVYPTFLVQAMMLDKTRPDYAQLKQARDELLPQAAKPAAALAPDLAPGRPDTIVQLRKAAAAPTAR